MYLLTTKPVARLALRSSAPSLDSEVTSTSLAEPHQIESSTVTRVVPSSSPSPSSSAEDFVVSKAHSSGSYDSFRGTRAFGTSPTPVASSVASKDTGSIVSINGITVNPTLRTRVGKPTSTKSAHSSLIFTPTSTTNTPPLSSSSQSLISSSVFTSVQPEASTDQTIPSLPDQTTPTTTTPGTSSGSSVLSSASSSDLLATSFSAKRTVTHPSLPSETSRGASFQHQGGNSTHHKDHSGAFSQPHDNHEGDTHNSTGKHPFSGRPGPGNGTSILGQVLDPLVNVTSSGLHGSGPIKLPLPVPIDRNTTIGGVTDTGGGPPNRGGDPTGHKKPPFFPLPFHAGPGHKHKGHGHHTSISQGTTTKVSVSGEAVETGTFTSTTGTTLVVSGVVAITSSGFTTRLTQAIPPAQAQTQPGLPIAPICKVSNITPITIGPTGGKPQITTFSAPPSLSLTISSALSSQTESSQTDSSHITSRYDTIVSGTQTSSTQLSLNSAHAKHPSMPHHSMTSATSEVTPWPKVFVFGNETVHPRSTAGVTIGLALSAYTLCTIAVILLLRFRQRRRRDGQYQSRSRFNSQGAVRI